MGQLFGKNSNWQQKKNSQATSIKNNKNNNAAISKDAEITDKDRAVLDLKNARDKLRRFRGQLEKDSQKLESQAKALIALRQKNRALLVLKLKKYKEKDVEKLDSKLMNVHSMIQDVEWASINVSVLSAIESGTRELRRMHDERSLDDVEALMDETNEAIEVENRINRRLAGQADILIDDQELESELEALMLQESGSVVPPERPVASAGMDLPLPPSLQPLPRAPLTALPKPEAATKDTAMSAAVLS
jgi:hypothetical protein